MANVIIVLILVVVVGIALKSTRNFLDDLYEKASFYRMFYFPDECDNPIIKEKVFKIKGMTCQHCVANVTRAINAIEGVSSQVNLKKEEAHVVYDRDVDDQVIIAAVKQAGYDVI